MKRIYLLLSMCLWLFATSSQGAEFRIGSIKRGRPLSLDPATVTTTVEFNIALQLFEGLTTFDAENNSVLPGVAERWEISPDGLTYTFFLRHNAVWSNGKAVTAATFRESWLRVLDAQTESDYAPLLFVIHKAKAYHEGSVTADEVGITVQEQFRLEVRLEHPAPFFLNLTALPIYMPVPDFVIQQVGVKWATAEQLIGNGVLIGNGPFLLLAWPDLYTVQLRKNPQYWDAESVSLERVQYQFLEDDMMAESAFNAYKANRLEWIITKNIDETLNNSPDLLRVALFATYFYRINVTRPPLNDLRVRQALSMALDRITIGKSVNKWGEMPALTFVPSSSVTNYANEPAYIEHPRKAQELLSEAGYPEGNNFPELHLLFNDNSVHETIAREIQRQWKKWLNIEVKLEKQEWGEYRERVSDLEYDIARSSWVGDYLDPSSFLDIFELPMSPLNRTGWEHPEYSRLVGEARYMADSKQRMALYQKAERILLQEGPIIPIYHTISLYLIKPYVRGIYPHPMVLHPLKHVRLGE